MVMMMMKMTIIIIKLKTAKVSIIHLLSCSKQLMQINSSNPHNL